MIYSLLVGGASFVVSLLLGWPLIRLLRARKIGKSISDDAPSTHMSKSGTPTMGGLFIFGTVAIVTLVTNLQGRLSILLPLTVLDITLAIGLWDDRGTLVGSLGRAGLTWRLKLALLAVLSAGVALVMYGWLDAHAVNIPWLGHYDIGPIYLVFAFATQVITGLFLARIMF